MLKTAATLPYMAALLASNTLGLEIVASQAEDEAESDAVDALYASMCLMDTQQSKERQRKHGSGRRASHATLTSERLRVKARQGHRRSASTVTEQNYQCPDTEWRPLFVTKDKGEDIRRIYPEKSPGRAHLAPISVNRRPDVSRSTRSSISSAASLHDCRSPSPVMDHHSECHQDGNFAGSPDVRADSKTHAEPMINTSEQRKHSNMTALPNYMSHFSNDDLRSDAEASCSRETSQTPGADVSNSGAASPEKGTSSPGPQRQPLLRSTSDSSTGSSRLTVKNLHKRGHARNESIASVWTVDSSPDSSRSNSPVTSRRKPLSLFFKPPVANMSAEPFTAPLGKTFSFPAIDENGVDMARIKSARPAIPPRISSRQRSFQNTRARSASTGPVLPRSLVAGASESWDDDFGDMDVEVPKSVRLSQQKVRNHLLLFRQFSEVIVDLERMRDRQQMAPSRLIPADHQVWHEIDALIAIASRGTEDASGVDIQYSGTAQDDVISGILGQFKRDGGRVRLNDRILSTLIAKAHSLIEDIEYVTTRGSPA